MKIPQKVGTKGSLKWIQILINKHPEIISRHLGIGTIRWLSPLSGDEYAEYRDTDFLNLLGLSHLKSQLQDFWPKSGPQWDALGRSENKVFLIEAKANIPEIKSSCAAKSPKSIAKIVKALNNTRTTLGVTDNQWWFDGYYQYANRLAHLYFLAERCGVDAELVFIYFCDDPTHVPTSITDWKQALADQKKLMGLSKLDRVSDLFINCQELK